MNLEIRKTNGNKNDTLPVHWDLCPKDSDDSLVTVWTNEQDAEAIRELLEKRDEGREA